MKYYYNNKEELLKKNKIWREKNKERLIEYRHIRYKEKAKKNIANGLTADGRVRKIRIDGQQYKSPKLPKVYKRSDFFKEYGMTMEEMGKKVGISREAIRRRFVRGIQVDLPKKVK